MPEFVKDKFGKERYALVERRGDTALVRLQDRHLCWFALRGNQWCEVCGTRTLTA